MDKMVLKQIDKKTKDFQNSLRTSSISYANDRILSITSNNLNLSGRNDSLKSYSIINQINPEIMNLQINENYFYEKDEPQAYKSFKTFNVNKFSNVSNKINDEDLMEYNLEDDSLPLKRSDFLKIYQDGKEKKNLKKNKTASKFNFNNNVTKKF